MPVNPVWPKAGGDIARLDAHGPAGAVKRIPEDRAAAEARFENVESEYEVNLARVADDTIDVSPLDPPFSTIRAKIDRSLAELKSPACPETPPRELRPSSHFAAYHSTP